LAAIRQGGFLPQRRKNFFSLRLKSVGGNWAAEKLEAAARLARRFGKARVHLTSRQGIEIPGIKLGDVEAVKKALAKSGLEPGRVGPRLRTVTACQGSAVCGHGWLDAAGLAVRIDRLFGGAALPHKFKIGVTGCANNCLKAEENDLGIKGAVVPEWLEEACNRCGACIRLCPGKALSLSREDLRRDASACLNCGRCLKACSRKAWTGAAGMKVFCGGVFGRSIRQGRPLPGIVRRRDELMRIIRATLGFFAGQAQGKERFAAVLERLGWEAFARNIEEARREKPAPAEI
jgi:dissimilatory sulfite reductase (desulfoviridin) alpha/beta subunit